MDAKPAYDAHDEGRKALADGDIDLAVEKADAAIRLFPDEAHFYALRGDVRFFSEQYDMAIGNYDIAIRRRADFFQYYLQRGLANEKLGKPAAALNDLEKSNELFPTAIAHFSLGNIAAGRGNRQKAIEHYAVVAGGQGEVAAAALEELVRLDLADNPGNYLQKQCFQDSNGNLGVSIGNPTPLAVAGVRYTVQFRDALGVQSRTEAVQGRIRAGTSVNVSTGLGPYSAGAGCPVQITAARVAE